MTSKDLLDELHKQRETLAAAIDLIEHLIRKEETPTSALLKSIRKYKKSRKSVKSWNKGIKTGKRNKKNKRHSGQKWTPEQKEKFLATMRLKRDARNAGREDGIAAAEESNG
jgi:hypothetical protein